MAAKKKKDDNTGLAILENIGEFLKDFDGEKGLQVAFQTFESFLQIQRMHEPPKGGTACFDGRGYVLSLGASALLFLDGEPIRITGEEYQHILKNYVK